METAILVYSHASAAGRVRRDVPLPPNFARIAIHEKEAMHAGYGGRTNHVIGSKAHHHSERQKGRADAGFRRGVAERPSRLLKNYSSFPADYGTRRYARSRSSAEPHVQLFVAGDASAERSSAAHH